MIGDSGFISNHRTNIRITTYVQNLPYKSGQDLSRLKSYHTDLTPIEVLSSKI